MIYKTNAFSLTKCWKQEWNVSAHLTNESSASRLWHIPCALSQICSANWCSCIVWQSGIFYSYNWSNDI